MEKQPQISIIIPVFNTETYLQACLDSVCGQTLHNIDIILMDDGSTDESGKICDRYAEKDLRIRVFHNKKQGHYIERNIGIDLARTFGSEYIGFVDSDDWIEPDMFKTMLNTALETGAEIVECGYFSEYPDKVHTWLPQQGVFERTEALCELFKGNSHDFLWNKLWKTTCLDHFPQSEKKYYQDMIITYRLCSHAKCISGIRQAFYHYRQFGGSIVHKHDMRLLDMWRNNREKYVFIQNEMQGKVDPETYREIEDNQLKKCVYAIGKNIVWWTENPKEEQEKNRDELKAMSEFIRQYTSFFGRKTWTRHERFTCLMARFPNPPVLHLAAWLEQIDLKTREHKYY